jgi:hypothetical protein
MGEIYFIAIDILGEIVSAAKGYNERPIKNNSKKITAQTNNT